MVPDKRDTSAFTLPMITSNIESCKPIKLSAQYKDRIFPSEERTARSSNIPANHGAVRQELERIKAEKAVRRAQREGDEAAAAGSPTASEGIKRLV
jgi:hypothetical protein